MIAMIYIVAQFICIIVLIINANFLKLNYFSWSLLIIGLIIGCLGIFYMRLNNLNIQPQLKTDHQLRTQGIYRIIRHPMYTGLITSCFGLVLTNPHILQSGVYLGLIVTLFLKSNKEEEYLLAHFEDYAQYRQRTGRFLPKKNNW